MPVRNIIKSFGANEYYHVYSRGINKQIIFNDDLDYEYFLSLFARYLSDTPAKSPSREPYPYYGTRLELLAFCLMPNHIHMLVYPHDQRVMTEYMRAVMTSYSIYFNKKYDRRGPLFESNYLASNIDRGAYLEHISRYIHLNPKHWATYPYSSLRYYTGKDYAPWVKPDKILQIFNSNVAEYIAFLKDYEAQKILMDELKHELAHS